MGAAEDRATLRERERVIAASNVTEIMIPGYGIWTRDELKRLLDMHALIKAGLDARLESERAS